MVAPIASESGAIRSSGAANARQPSIRVESFDRRERRDMAEFFIDGFLSSNKMLMTRGARRGLVRSKPLPSMCIQLSAHADVGVSICRRAEMQTVLFADGFG